MRPTTIYDIAGFIPRVTVLDLAIKDYKYLGSIPSSNVPNRKHNPM